MRSGRLFPVIARSAFSFRDEAISILQSSAYRRAVELIKCISGRSASAPRARCGSDRPGPRLTGTLENRASKFAPGEFVFARAKERDETKARPPNGANSPDSLREAVRRGGIRAINGAAFSLRPFLLAAQKKWTRGAGAERPFNTIYYIDYYIDKAL